MSLKDHSYFIFRDLVVPIYYEDTDFTGFVYHANYLKYFERAREEALGREFLSNLYQQGQHFVVKDAAISYKKPTKHGQELVVKSKAVFSSPLVLEFRQEALDKNTLVVNVIAKIDLILLNSNSWPLRIKQELKDKIINNCCGV
jgi:acyl-CoA thioester hydrolase